jgi:hypothetical protein
MGSMLAKIAETVIGAMLLVWVKKWFSGSTWKGFATDVWKKWEALDIKKGFGTMLASIRFWLLIGSVVSSFTAGVIVTHKWYSIEKLEADNAQFRRDAQRMKIALGVNDKIDAEDADVEKLNQGIMDELFATKHRADTPVVQRVVQRVEVPQSCPEAKPHPACLTDAGMRKLGKLR